MILRLAGIKYESIVDGPGVRAACFVQGCSHRCPGCHNPETHDPAGGYSLEVDDLLRILSECRDIDGVTISGGEPFEQSTAVAALAAGIRQQGYNLVIYSGYTFDYLLSMSREDRSIRIILESTWLLIDGPYRQGERDLTLPYRGSANQRIIDLPLSLRTGKPLIWSQQQ